MDICKTLEVISVNDVSRSRNFFTNLVVLLNQYFSILYINSVPFLKHKTLMNQSFLLDFEYKTRGMKIGLLAFRTSVCISGTNAESRL